MDVRAAVMAGVALAWHAAVAEPMASDSLRSAGLETLRGEAEVQFDAATAAEWDDLLADPVDLDHGDLDRLQVLPWIGPDELASLVAARPLASLAELSRLPGWSPELARRVVPFVHLAPRHVARPVFDGSLRLTAQAVQVRAATSGARLTARCDPRAAADASGGIRFATRHTVAILGDFTFGFGQGAWLATGTLVPRAGSPGWRAPRGFGLHEGVDRTSVIRGGGWNWKNSRVDCSLLGGMHATGRAAAMAVAWRVGRDASVQASAARVGRSGGGSCGIASARGATHWAIEAATAKGARALELAAETHLASTRLGARWRSTPFGWTAPLADVTRTDRAGTTRIAQLWADAAGAGLAWDAGWVESLRREPGGTRRRRTEWLVAARRSLAATAFEVRLTARVNTIDTWDDVATLATTRAASNAFSIRARRDLAPGWAATLTWRGARADGPAPEDSLAMLGSGSAWQVELERWTGHWRPAIACTSFDIQPGLPIVESLPGSVFGSAQLRGNGIRFAAALELHCVGLDLAAGGWSEWRAASLPRAAARCTITLHGP